MRVTAATVLVLVLATPAARSQVGEPSPGRARFEILLHGKAIGTADATLTRSPGGWTVSGTSRLGAPFDIAVNRFDAQYDAAWQPRSATLDLSTPTGSLVVHGGFGGGDTSRIDLVRNRQVVFLTTRVAPDALVLPHMVFSAYEALAARLDGAMPGSTLRAYVLPQREVGLRLDRAASDTMQQGARSRTVQRWRITFLNPGHEVPADVWVASGRLVRLDLPGQALSVVKQDAVER